MFHVNIPVAVFSGALAPFFGTFVQEIFCLVDLMATLSNVLLPTCYKKRHLFKYSVVSIYVSPNLTENGIPVSISLFNQLSFHQLGYLSYATMWGGESGSWTF